MRVFGRSMIVWWRLDDVLVAKRREGGEGGDELELG